MPLIARQRSRLAVLAVLALVGSLLAVSAVPAVAADHDEADHEATYSACVGAATEDAGFTDMGNSFAADAANCLIHYGITSGTGDGSTFSPDKAVSRLQMARFLSRAAGPAGVDTEMVSSQEFTDISDLSDEAQDAINTVAYLDIMTPRSAGIFDPAGTVTREDMAIHLSAFLGEAAPGPGGALIDFQDKDGLADSESPFTDIDGVSFGAHRAIRDIFELGVAEGTTDTSFSPDRPVSRAQMAAFITRALAHTNARPAGLTIQSDTTDVFVGDTVEITASLRDSTNAPIENAAIDFFRLKKGKDDPFNDDGECRSTRVQSVKGSLLCEIDRGDKDTNPEGNLDADEVSFNADGDTTVWAWTGKQGAEFDSDDDDSVMVDISANPAAADVKMTSDLPNGVDTAKFGEDVTLTFQVVDSDGDAVAKKDVAVTLTEDYGNNKDSTDTYKTDDSGMFERVYNRSDPNSGKEDAALSLTVTVVASKIGTDDIDVIDGDGATVTSTTMMWDDNDGSLTHLSLKADPKYQTLPGAATVAHGEVTATVTDQYGSPLKGETVWFVEDDATFSDNDDATDDNLWDSLRTNSRGQASFDISHAITTGSNTTVTIRAIAIQGTSDYTTAGVARTEQSQGAELGEGERPIDDPDDIGASTSGTDVDVTDAINVMFHWANTVTADLDAGTDVILGDTDNDVILVEDDDDDPSAIEYDDDDWLTVIVSADSSHALNGDGIAALEKGLTAINNEEATGTLELDEREDEDGDGINRFTLTLTVV